MRLTLSARSPLNSIYSTDTGLVLYKVDAKGGFNPLFATIEKASGEGSTVNSIWHGEPERVKAGARPPVQHKGSNRNIKDDPVRNDTRQYTSPVEDSGPSASVVPVHFTLSSKVVFWHGWAHPARFFYNGLNIPAVMYFRKGDWRPFYCMR